MHMSIFAISDLHLSSDNKKSMEIFGPKWADYMNRIKENWESSISGEDVVIIPGDISWGTYIEDSVDDFKFLHSLPGKKIVLKGNHDYWWTTFNKLNEFLKENNFNSISFLNNNSVVYENTLICGTRGWNCPEESDFSEEDRKIFNRELQRLKLSIESGKNKKFDRIIAALHFPPFNKNKELNEDFAKIFEKFKVDICLYGHLHGPSHKEAFEGKIGETEFKFVAADYLGFKPFRTHPPTPSLC